MIRHTTRDIRRSNRLTALRSIYAARNISRQEIARQTGLSSATIANVVSDLLRNGIVAETGFEDSDGGRPRALLGINSEGGYVVGVDIAETYIRFDLFDLTFHVRHSVDHTLHPEDNDLDDIVEHIVRGLDELLSSLPNASGEVLGVGISLPGQVDPVKGVSVFAPNWGWHDVPLLSMLRARVDLPLCLDNPLKASAVAQLWFGRGRTRSNLVTINIGTGVGAGVIVDGSLYRGVTNSAGEWGHTSIVYDGRECRCGSRGCVEAYVGVPGIMRTIHELDSTSTLLYDNDQTRTIDSLTNGAYEGDRTAIAVLEETAKYLGVGIANILNMYNPEAVVIGGWAGRKLAPFMLPLLHEHVRKYALQRTLEVVSIEPCTLADDPVSLGAAIWVIEWFLANAEAERRRAGTAVIEAI